MKSKSTLAIIRNIKSSHKKVGYAQAAQAIEKKLSEIKKGSSDIPAREASIVVFGHLA
jgi:hypothetical protein